MSKKLILVGALALSALGVAACSGDDTSAPTPEPDAGRDGSAAGVDAGRADATSDAGTDAPPITDAADASDASTPSYALFVGTDFKTAELSVVSLHPDAVSGRLAIPDQDSVPFTSGGSGFVLERAAGSVVVLDHAQPWTSTGTIDIDDSSDAAPYASNPRTVLVTTGTKAYVGRYASNVVKVVDVASKTVTGSVDFSAFKGADDGDGLVEVQDAVYDAATKRAYFLLERIDQFDFSGTAPDYVSKCLATHGAIVAIDVTTDTVVDLNGAAAGQAIELLGENPAELIGDLANGRFIVPDTGCYESPDGGVDAGPTTRAFRGIESVTVASGARSWLYQSTSQARIGGVILIDGTHAFVNQGGWYAWNPAQTTLGAPVSGFPQAPFYDGTGRIVGLSAAQPDAGSDAGVTWSVVAWDVATAQISTLATMPFQSVVPVSTFGVSSALLH